MKAKKFLWVLMACVLSLSLVAFAACDAGETDQFTVESVTLQETAEVEVGKSVTLSYTVTPEDCTDTVSWRSSDTSVATVSNGGDNVGQVTGVAAGTAVITLQVGNLSDTCTVTVMGSGSGTVEVTGVTLDQTGVTLYINGESGADTVTLTATVTPENATDKTVTWTSDKEAVATVANGVVKAVGEGTATITATAGSKSATCTVTVIDSSKYVEVSSAADLVAAVANSENAGKTIVLAEDSYTLTETVFITQDITLEGSNSTLTGGEWEGVAQGHASVITVTNGADVTIRNLTVTGAQKSGSVYGHGVNLAQAGTVTLENVTATNNSGVGVLVNDTVATLNNVSTSGNAWGGVNVDVVGRDWTVPATVLTVDADCDFAETAQIYCDDAAEAAALEGKLALPAAYHKVTSTAVATVVWTDAVETDTTVDTITIGDSAYTLTYATNGTAVTNNDSDGGWADGNPKSGVQNLTGDFAIVYTWTNSRDQNYADTWVELFDANGKYIDVAVCDPGTNGSYNIWGFPTDSDNLVTGTTISASYTVNGEIETSLPTLGTANAFGGDYVTYVVRVGSTLKVVVTLTQDTNVKVYTYTVSDFTTDAITLQLSGNTYWLDNITVATAALTEVTA